MAAQDLLFLRTQGADGRREAVEGNCLTASVHRAQRGAIMASHNCSECGITEHGGFRAIELRTGDRMWRERSR